MCDKPRHFGFHLRPSRVPHVAFVQSLVVLSVAAVASSMAIADDVADQQLQTITQAEPWAPTAIALSADGRFAAAGFKSGVTVVGDLRAVGDVIKLPSQFRVEDIAFSPDGKHLVVLHYDLTVPAERRLARVHVWDIGKRSRRWTTEQEDILDVAATEKYIVLIRRRSVEYRPWSNPSSVVSVLEMPRGCRFDARIDREVVFGQVPGWETLYVVARHGDGTWRVIRAAPGQSGAAGNGMAIGPAMGSTMPRAVAVAGSLGLVAVAFSGDVLLLDAPTLKVLKRLSWLDAARVGPTDVAGVNASLVFSRDGRNLIAFRQYNYSDHRSFDLVAWDWATGRRLWVDRMPQDSEHWDQFAASSNARWVLVSSGSGKLDMVALDELKLRPPRTPREFLTLAGVDITTNGGRVSRLTIPGSGSDVANDRLLEYVRFFPHVRQLTALETTSGGEITDHGLLHIARLDRLTQLKLKSRSISARGLNEIAIRCPVEELEVDAPGLTDLSWLPHMRALRKLTLAVPKVPPAGFRPVRDCRTMEELTLSGNVQVDERVLRFVAASPRLKSLDLSGCTRVGDKAVAELVAARSLTALDLKNTGVSDGSMAYLQRLPVLQRLSLWGTNITEASVSHLRTMRQLKTLCIVDTSLPERAVLALQEALPQCEIVK